MKKIFLSLLLSLSSTMAIEVGHVPPTITLLGDNGAKIDGSAWHSTMLKGKIYTVFYVDPDEKDLNQPLAQALQARKFDRKQVDSVAIINLAATWIPNTILETILKKKQKEFPHTLYVKDKKKVLVKKWKLADDNSVILIFDKQGKLIYKKFGKLSDIEIKKVLALIEKHL